MTIIRDFHADDESQLFELVSSFPTPSQISRANFSEIFKEKLSNNSAVVRVALIDAQMVGYVSAYIHQAFYAHGNVVWVDEILVTPECREMNVGRELMSSIEVWALDKNASLVTLATNGARGFYSKLDYETKAGYYKKYLDSNRTTMQTPHKLRLSEALELQVASQRA